MAKKRTIRQNRPEWRKVRGMGKRLIRGKRDKPLTDKYGRLRFDDIKIKTKKWERAK